MKLGSFSCWEDAERGESAWEIAMGAEKSESIPGDEGRVLEVSGS